MERGWGGVGEEMFREAPRLETFREESRFSRTAETVQEGDRFRKPQRGFEKRAAATVGEDGRFRKTAAGSRKGSLEEMQRQTIQST